MRVTVKTSVPYESHGKPCAYQRHCKKYVSTTCQVSVFAEFATSPTPPVHKRITALDKSQAALHTTLDAKFDTFERNQASGIAQLLARMDAMAPPQAPKDKENLFPTSSPLHKKAHLANGNKMSD